MNPKDIKAELEFSLDSLRINKSDEFIRKIRPILESNLDRGRIHSFTEGRVDLVQDYVARVAGLYETLSPFINELQIERTTQLWEPLFKKLQIWAYKYFLKKNYYNNIGTQEIAFECSTEAAINILSARFPYDTEFDPWAYVIVQYACLKYIRRETKKSVIPPKKLVALDDALDHFSDPIFFDQQQNKDLHEELLIAISHLSEARRRVVELIYFEELSPCEVARIMGSSIGAIYNMKFSALIDLQRICKRNGIYINE